MLLLSVVWAWTAWNLYTPYQGKWGFLRVLSFVFGALFGELGLHLIALELLLTLLFISIDELSGLADALGLAIAMASWAAITLFYFRAQRSQPVMEQAVRCGLDLAPEAPLPRAGVTLHRPDFARLLNPFNFTPPRTMRQQNIVYHSDAGRDLHLDIYGPLEIPNNAPVLFQIHGGAWLDKLGSKEQQGRPLMAQMAENGWLCVAIQYRLSPAATFPDHIIDCKRALCWVKDHIAEYGGDPDFIVATGGSAGGHLSSLLALSANAPQFQPGFEHCDTRVQGCVPLYGFHDFLDLKRQRVTTSVENLVFSKLFKQSQAEAPELWKSACPATWVSEDAPPFLLIHGEADTLVPARESRNLYEDLRAVSRNSVAYAELPDAQHGFDIVLSLRCQTVVNAICIYLVELHRRHKQSLTETSGSETGSDAPH